MGGVCGYWLSSFFPTSHFPHYRKNTEKGFNNRLMNTYATVVLAAGKGTRMRSKLSKLLHPLAGVPLLGHVLKAVEAIPSTTSFRALTATVYSHRPIVVLGHAAEQIIPVF